MELQIYYFKLDIFKGYIFYFFWRLYFFLQIQLGYILISWNTKPQCNNLYRAKEELKSQVVMIMSATWLQVSGDFLLPNVSPNTNKWSE